MSTPMMPRSLLTLEFTEVLDYLAGFTLSEAGQEACLMVRPLSSLEEIEEQATFFEEGRLWLVRHRALFTAFPSIDDLWAENSAVYSPGVLWSLRYILQLALDIRQTFVVDNSPYPLWKKRCEQTIFPSNTLSALIRCLTEDGLFKDSASAELSHVRSEIRGLHKQCTTRVKGYATEYNIMHYLQDDFMTLSSDRYVLPLKANFKGRLQGIVHEYSQTGETCYFEPLFLVEINNKLQELKRQEREEERKILFYLSSLVQEQRIAIKEIYDFLIALDLLVARAALAECYDGRLVDISPEFRVNLIEAVHPLLLLANAEKGRAALLRTKQRKLKERSLTEEHLESTPSLVQVKKNIVPSTIELKEGQQALIISGGNAGGKTVCLKTLGLIALMSSCALPCPVGKGSTLPLWKTIHAFIGDEQSLEDHVSTFTAQITHLAEIWDSLGVHDLVILDEFGAGTDPSQGAALAQAVIDSIVESGAYTIAATHFPALKAYALSAKGVRSASVLFDPKTKKPLYKLVYEQVGASQALDVAREHGLPETILSKASKYLLLSGEDTSSLVDRLNELAVEKEAEIVKLTKQQKSVEEKRIKLEKKFEEDKARLFDSLQADARSIMAELKKNKITHKQALKDLQAVRQQVFADEKENKIKERIDITTLSLGDSVKHATWQRTGRVQEIDAKKHRIRLDMDGVTMWAKLEDISLIHSSHPKGQVLSQHTANLAQNIPSLQLDLRGKRADIAINEVEKFLDKAILQSFYQVEVIHGRGTGVLRRELHTFLKNFAPVSHFYLAPENMGGDGMTIVELK